MVNVRRGINIRVGFSVYRNGIPEDMAEAQTIRVVIRHKSLPNSSAAFTGSAVKVLGNSVSVVVSDIMQRTMAAGLYYIEVAYRLVSPTAPDGYDPYIVDADVFELVERSLDPNDIVIQTVNIPGEVSFSSQALDEILVEASGAVQAANAAAEAANDAAAAAMAIVDSKIDLDGLNSNIRQLKFNTATPVAPTQAGQMAWSDEEGTLALHNGLHTHPIGRETFFKAKNNSGALIANGKAVYAIGSTGANATIGLATTANGDIAQRTIGIATMDIASNGFGDVTTFGEVNDINTSALTEGALVYLGLNGNLTSVEPVAPTPKISLGLCIRSHLTQGRIAVYVRPIARLNKLTDVYAPNLLDGDVLRWNGTALRYEVYNLVNKADLVGGKVPASQLPAYVDDILEYATFAAFPAVGETGKLYVTLDTNLTYRWSGSAYTEVSKSLAIGITSTTAFRGDWGKIAYDHSQLTNSNPHGTTAAQIANTPAGTIAATTVQAAINELDADRVQVETDLNQTDIKNAEQDVSIKSIEQLLSQSNLNQTAQVSSSGREIVSLPKTASNGGMEVKLERLTAQNLVVNGDFRNGTTGWDMVTITNGVAVNTIVGYNLLNGYSSAIYNYFQFFNNKKYYFKTKARVTYAGANSIELHKNLGQPMNTTFVTNPVQNQWYQHSEIKQATANLSGQIVVLHGFPNDSALLGKTMEIAYLFIIDLTATFGAGNEPDLATCDAMFSTYFEGTKSFVPAGRVRSVGKNIWNTTLESGSIGADGALFVNTSFTRPKDYISVIPNTNYKISKSDLQPFYAYINYYDINRKGISQSVSSINQFTTPSNCYFIKFSRVDTETLVNLQIEKGSVATPYEPYKEAELYLTAPDLRSNGLVKDEIRKGANGYEFVKRVSEIDGTALNTPIITPIEHAGIINSAESGTVYHEPVVADAGIYGTNMTVLNTTYPISSLEEIMVHTNVDTYLDVSKAVVSGDGLSFTHPDLRAGDLVLFTYFFSKEKVNGLITATYYNGRYVIADTANGKFYKWGVKATNGVATIQLTEV